MKTVKDKYLVVGADFAGFPLKEVVVEHLEKKGWKILDLGVKKDSDPNDTDLMFHRVGLRVGAEIAEGNYERALVFCGTGMGIHIAALIITRINGAIKHRNRTRSTIHMMTWEIFFCRAALSFSVIMLRPPLSYRS